MTDSTARGGTRPFRFGVVAPLRSDLPTWRDQVRRIADYGYSTLLMPDVPQWQPAPAPTLAVAATNARAIAVYRSKFGFVEVATLPNEFNNGQEYLLMRLDLSRPDASNK